MAGPGGGPSRRSHTKSRKGCKTCKRRHIRCDETFPQCRNCTKHQVRCDYMDGPAPVDDAMRVSAQPNLLWTTEIERTVDAWRQSGVFPFSELQVFPQPQWQSMSKTDLRLIYHVANVTSELQSSRTSNLSLWTDLMPKFLSIAASHSFVMHAVLAFSANHLAWISQSPETRQIAFHHGGIAMKGLHQALGGFSKANADAVLAASLLLSWQSMDWRGWASLMTGTKNVLMAMHAWRDESIFADFISQQGISPAQHFTNEAHFVSPEVRQEHLSILQRVQVALQRVQPYLGEPEARWIDQLNVYVQRLRTTNPPQTPEEQFSQLYTLRKWLFWVPITLLSSRKRDIYTLLVLAHFYAVALALVPIFPDTAPPFLANMVLFPLEEIVKIINTYQTSPTYSSMAQTAIMMMDFPREALNNYRVQREWTQQQLDTQHGIPNQSPYALETLNLDLGNHIAEYGYSQSLSPAFAPSPLHLSPPTMPTGNAPRSPYLEVPRSGVDYAYSSAGSGYSTPMGSPGAPSPSIPSSVTLSSAGVVLPAPSVATAGPSMVLPSYKQEEDAFSFSMAYGGNTGMGMGGYSGIPGGFVAPATVWT
ncbi:hypothetical protein EJ06DRAFT_240523 [Trichodelitschia bisporula]|uniref:Zn(2)-C6 fungal-type domain-containing protein n=1 Tax=Trichodelitschia bisporula TaxID=703511 RepID=A0A6G1HKS1_9PEZI|nr:hypothetical protein EJ06DRAFT_240523 [Trichodelitschia bisporula]